MIRPKTIGKNVETNVHFTLLVSLKIVYIVVEQGLCSKLKSIRFNPVNKVHPPAWRILAVSEVESSSNMTPEPSPKPKSALLRTVNISMVGITISLAAASVSMARM